MKELLPDVVWEDVRTLLPSHAAHPKGGRGWCDDRQCLRGIPFVKQTGIPWQYLPAEAFGVSGSTCWRRLRDWTAAGVWPALHRRALDRLAAVGAVDHSLGIVDAANVRAVFGGRTPGPTRSTAASVGASVT
ncbi:MAG TPA: transposase [Tepidisphaeraceae bacterium]|nr:transposase [Tepidisphaeraceae bacterium]